jgi:hypothetical protein
VKRNAGDLALGFECGSLGALNSFEGAADRIRFAAEDFELGGMLKVLIGLVRPAEPTQRQAPEIKHAWVAAAATYSLVEQVKAVGDALREKRVNASPVEVVEDGVLPPAGCCRKSDGGSTKATQFPRHEQGSPLVSQWRHVFDRQRGIPAPGREGSLLNPPVRRHLC